MPKNAKPPKRASQNGSIQAAPTRPLIGALTTGVMRGKTPNTQQLPKSAKDPLAHTSIGLRLTGESAKSARFAQILELLLYPFTHGPSTWAGIFLTSALGAAIGFTLAFLYAKYIGGAP